MKIALVLGGGGLKGFAHLGVLRALEELGIVPSVYAGTSIGALIASAYVGGTPLADLERRAAALKQRDLFQIDHFGMVARRMRNPSLYLEHPLRALVDAIVPEGTFEALPLPVLVNTVHLERGEQLIFGLPGLRDVPLRDAVYASCALPGFFPPGLVGRHWCVDGGVMDNVPAAAASHGADLVIAVDVGSSSIAISRGVHAHGFAAIYQRAAQVMMHELQRSQLALWKGPPMLFVRPKVWHFDWFSFGRSAQFVAAGYQATIQTLAWLDEALDARGGIYPRQRVALSVEKERCTGCTLCAAIAPQWMRMGDDGKAEPIETAPTWSRADGAFVSQCPVNAIRVRVPEHGRDRTSGAYVPLED